METRSTFVTVLAWIFIVGAGFASLVTIMQVVMVSTMFNSEEFQSMPEDAPLFAKIIQQYLHIFVYSFCALTIFTLISAIGLLKRKNWARLAFVGILTLGIIWQVGGLVMQYIMFSTLPEFSAGEGFEEFELMSNIIRWFSFAVAVAMSVLFIWVIKKLVTQPILGEFILEK